MWEPALRVWLLQFLASDHDGDGGFGDKVVGKRTEKDSALKGRGQ